MNDQKSYSGRCFCGAVEIVATGEPVAMGYCHCASCRHWSAGPVNAFTLWQPQSVRVTKGGEHVEGYQKSDTSVRKFCELCGGHLYTEHPTWGVTDVYAALLPDFKYVPALHVNYQESVLRIRDGLPKYKDMPAEMGGSGDLLPE
ncbi:GFA family protein [Rhizobium sp. BG6]|uniref:GFA family protein n=1 Tax=Rhizobium sp. BG6 TaxID=2613771 RepID=UPI00193E2F39|nr:GFA family protein [Rhizobium sp. BG6]QRM48632.1 GFA family protein [Rhizobium sp. BG6]